MASTLLTRSDHTRRDRCYGGQGGIWFRPRKSERRASSVESSQQVRQPEDEDNAPPVAKRVFRKIPAVEVRWDSDLERPVYYSHGNTSAVVESRISFDGEDDSLGELDYDDEMMSPFNNDNKKSGPIRSLHGGQHDTQEPSKKKLRAYGVSRKLVVLSADGDTNAEVLESSRSHQVNNSKDVSDSTKNSDGSSDDDSFLFCATRDKSTDHPGARRVSNIHEDAVHKSIDDNSIFEFDDYKPEKKTKSAAQKHVKPKSVTATPKPIKELRKYYERLDKEKLTEVSGTPTCRSRPTIRTHRAANRFQVSSDYRQHVVVSRQAGVEPLSFEEFAANRSEFFGSATELYDGILDD